MVTAMTFIQGQEESRIYSVAYQPALESGQHARFLAHLKSNERLSVKPLAGDVPAKLTEYDAVLSEELSKDKKVMRLRYVGDRPESTQAHRFLSDLHREFNEQERKKWMETKGLSPEAIRPFLILGQSTAASGDVGGYLLGALLPIGLLVMIALGGAYPAIDTTAGERERGTWETVQSCGPSLSTILISKYLFVSLVCCLSGLLNLFAMLVSIRSIVAPLLRENESITFSVGPQTMLVLLVGVVCVSFFVAAALMLCSIFARTFREGQALTTPMFMMIALPVLPLSDPALQLNTKLAFVPLVNLALVWRQALQGEYHLVYIVQTMTVLGVLVALALWFGSRLLQNESLMTGSGAELSWKRFWGVVKGVFRGK
jgi:sodium transport system permease protein